MYLFFLTLSIYHIFKFEDYEIFNTGQAESY